MGSCQPAEVEDSPRLMLLPQEQNRSGKLLNCYQVLIKFRFLSTRVIKLRSGFSLTDVIATILLNSHGKRA